MFENCLIQPSEDVDEWCGHRHCFMLWPAYVSNGIYVSFLGNTALYFNTAAWCSQAYSVIICNYPARQKSTVALSICRCYLPAGETLQKKQLNVLCIKILWAEISVWWCAMFWEYFVWVDVSDDETTMVWPWQRLQTSPEWWYTIAAFLLKRHLLTVILAMF